MKIDKEQIATICHEANRAFCASIGDFSQADWNAAPQWQRDSAIKGVDFHLTALDSGIEPTPSASHDSWLEEKRSNGWTYGPVKDAEKKTHPCFMPYDGLPLEQRMKDYIFAGIVKSFGNYILGSNSEPRYNQACILRLPQPSPDGKQNSVLLGRWV